MKMSDEEMALLNEQLGHPDDYADDEYEPAGSGLEPLKPGEMLRTLRELAQWSQVELSARCGIPQTVISAIEGGRTGLGAERTKALARALRVHPAVILFSDWRGPEEYIDDGEAAA